MQEVAVIQRLQAEIAELQIAFRQQSRGQTRQVELGQLRIQQFAFDALLDEAREILKIFGWRIGLSDFLAEHFLADGVHQQTRRDLAVGRVLFHQRARRQNGRFVQFFHRHAVVQIFYGFRQDGVRVDVLFQADAGCRNQIAHLAHVQWTAFAVFDDMDLRRRLVLRTAGRALLAAFFHALGAIQHICPRNIVFAGTHQRQFDLVLDVFNMESAAGRLTAHQRRNHIAGQLLDHLAHPRGRRAVAAVDGKESLGDRD